jgi:putative hydrolase of the HAD superfamily
MDERHHLTFDTYEEGKLSLDEYLNRILFYEERAFTKEEFIEFMYAQSKPFPDMINLACNLKRKYHLKLAVISNEGRELTTYRIGKFELGSFIDFFVVSSFVHIRKPDVDIFKIALDIAQIPADKAVYIEDRAMFVDVAQSLGIKGIIHQDYRTTRAELSALGLSL